MSSKIILSVVFPTFERDETIGLALKSILSNISHDIQEFIEILVLDNYSQDKTVHIVNSLINSNKEIKNFKLIRNETNLGYDLNHYKAYTEAAGDFIWFCSDRYIYNINIKTIVNIIQVSHNVNAITFSNLFRKKNDIGKISLDIDSIDKMFETYNFSTFNGEFKEENQSRYYQTSNLNLVNNDVNNIKGIILTANVSDSIVRIYRDSDWLKRLKLYNGTFMLVVASLLKPYNDFNKDCVIINIPFFSNAFHRINFKGGRHLNSQVAYGHLMLQEDFPFVGEKEEIIMFHINVLLNLRIQNISKKSKSVNVIKIMDIFNFCDRYNFKLPFLLKVWINLFKISFLPQIFVTPITLINKVIFKIYEVIKYHKKQK